MSATWRKLLDSRMLAGLLFILWGCTAAWASWITSQVEDVEQIQAEHLQRYASIKTEIDWLKKTCVRIEEKIDGMNP